MKGLPCIENPTMREILIENKRSTIYLSQNMNGDPIIIKEFAYYPDFQNESRFADLDHDNIIRFSGINEEEQLIYMEYASNGNLYDFLSTHKVEFQKDIKLARTFFKPIVEAVYYLHSKGNSHLDLKLANILIDEKYRVMITDFDMSYMKDDEDVFAYGTANSRSPELELFEKENSKDIIPKAADIFSLGIILFQLVTISDPYIEGKECQAYIRKGQWDKFWDGHKIDRNSEFAKLVEKMLKWEKGKRITIEEVMIDPFVGGEIYTPVELSEIFEPK